jgi:hypothetical protein
MEKAAEKSKINDIAFFLLMGILSFTVLVTIGYLVYELFWG